jgi:hypothetical protein
MKATFKLEKETKGALRYIELDANGAPTIELMGTLYVRKSAFPTKPAMIVVTVEPAA